MTESSIKSALGSLHIHPQAAEVYLSVLKNTQSNANEIARDTGLPRSTVYLQTENLVHQGLLVSAKQNKTKFFTAASPKTLVDIAKRQLETSESLVPSLQELAKNSRVQKPFTTLYVGKSAVRNLLEDFLLYAKEKKATIFSLTDSQVITTFPKFFPAWVNKRESFQVHTQIMAVTQENPGEVFLVNTKYKSIRFLPKSFEYEGMFKIADDKILFISLDRKNIYAVEVKSKIIARMCRVFFQYMWASLDKKN